MRECSFEQDLKLYTIAKNFIFVGFVQTKLFVNCLIFPLNMYSISAQVTGLTYMQHLIEDTQKIFLKVWHVSVGIKSFHFNITK